MLGRKGGRGTSKKKARRVKNKEGAVQLFTEKEYGAANKEE